MDKLDIHDIAGLTRYAIARDQSAFPFSQPPAAPLQAPLLLTAQA
jgi:hypothetical protein